MQLKQSRKSTTPANGKRVTDMTGDEYARWLCLLEAIEHVSSKMNQFGHRLQNKEIDWIKSLAFQKYIDERFETMKADLNDLENNKEYAEFNVIPQKKCITSLEPALQ